MEQEKKQKTVTFDFGHTQLPLSVPHYADILRMGKAAPLSDPQQKIRNALDCPFGTLPLKRLIQEKLLANPRAKASVVISDNTRPVPYRGESGILAPLVRVMMDAGLSPQNIRLVVATGTHRPMRESELRDMLDPQIFSLGLQIINHDGRKRKDLVPVGRTEIGGEILINRIYVESDIKILTGLVESHFMAGASGGRKSICPGLLAEASTHILHSGPILESPDSRDLVLSGNPVHEESLRVARMAGCDMILNVTLDSNFMLTGVFAGELEEAHNKAFEKLTSYVAIPFSKKYDLAVSHAGYVGVNHYQAAKGALIFEPLIKKEGTCVLAAIHTEKDPLGGPNYIKMMSLLREMGAEKFNKLIQDPDWEFVPEQWEAQMWTRLFKKTSPEKLIYCSLEIPRESFSWIPGTDARSLLPRANDLRELVENTVALTCSMLRERLGREPRMSVLPDGPYGIPVFKEDPA